MRIETPAKGVKGFLLYSPISKMYFFRVYDETDKSIFTDYSLVAEDIEIELISEYNALYEGDGRDSILDYNSKVLGRSPTQDRKGE